MNVQPLGFDKSAAFAALQQYKAHRNTHDARDWEIERIYRAISRGRLVIDAFQAIREAGLDEAHHPKLAICRADAIRCACDCRGDSVEFFPMDRGEGWRRSAKIVVEWPSVGNHRVVRADVPRIPPQHRPVRGKLSSYHLLWEADWQDVPTDPMLLKRIGRAAWVVCAAWDLTPVEIAVMRAHRGQQR